jgi:hypothetical protein
MEEVYFRRRDGGEFDVSEVEAWVSSLPGGFRRTNSPGEDVFIVVDDEESRQHLAPRYAIDPYFGDGTLIQIGRNVISLWLDPSDRINAQVKSFVCRLLDTYDCVISDGTADVTAKVKANIDVIF